ncbi:hypothetical protein BH93_11425 [Rhodococcoides fascians A25f]|uniref:hypothetical protein n=1 Tax=Rhodococcoides fascians TaxID=1828 RepID=UPI00055D8E5E|nr:hypothetical protein [Rhodococcus fascians]QII05901.1 hypothetical protein BH93_11425 [Rhodococcus fascians A25f]
MALVTIAHALFSWTEDGTARLATHGQTVDIDDSIVAEFEHLGVFEPAGDLHDAGDLDAATGVQDEPLSAGEPGTTEGTSIPNVTSTPPALDRPKTAATKAVWAAYAQKRGIDADALDKDEIIAAVTQLDTPKENTNG